MTMGVTGSAQNPARPEGVYDVSSRIAERLSKITEMLDALERRVNGDVPRDVPDPIAKLPGPLALFPLMQRLDAQVNLISDQCQRLSASIGV